MTKFDKINTNFFVVFFALAAVAEFIGFLTGKMWCIWAALFSAIISAMVYYAAKSESKKCQTPKNQPQCLR